MSVESLWYLYLPACDVECQGRQQICFCLLQSNLWQEAVGACQAKTKVKSYLQRRTNSHQRTPEPSHIAYTGTSSHRYIDSSIYICGGTHAGSDGGGSMSGNIYPLTWPCWLSWSDWLLAGWLDGSSGVAVLLLLSTPDWSDSLRCCFISKCCDTKPSY